jgi:hypothetical protein
MKWLTIVFLFVAGSLFFWATPAAAQNAKYVASNAETKSSISERDRREISTFYASERAAGNFRKKDPNVIPVTRGGTLPVDAVVSNVPSDLLARLTTLTGQAAISVVGADVVLYNKKTRRVLDVLPNVAY